MKHILISIVFAVTALQGLSHAAEQRGVRISDQVETTVVEGADMLGVYVVSAKKGRRVTFTNAWNSYLKVLAANDVTYATLDANGAIDHDLSDGATPGTVASTFATMMYANSIQPTNVTPVDAGDEDAEFYLLLVDGGTGGQATETDIKFRYNPLTGLLTVPSLNLSDVVSVGSAAMQSDGDVVMVGSAQFLNTASESIYGYEIGFVVEDNTDGTEDTAPVLYRTESGIELVAIYFGGPLSSAPTTWAPATNCRVRASGEGATAPWDTNQWVRWSGAAWEADATTTTVASTGDSATGFFPSGTIELERGGLEADLSTHAGLVRIQNGTTVAVNDEATLEDAIGVAMASEAEAQSYASGQIDGFYVCSSYVGGVTGSLDSLDITGAGTPNTDDLADGHIALALSPTGNVRPFVFNATATFDELLPVYVQPDDYSTAGVWIDNETISYDLDNGEQKLVRYGVWYCDGDVFDGGHVYLSWSASNTRPEVALYAGDTTNAANDTYPVIGEAYGDCVSGNPCVIDIGASTLARRDGFNYINTDIGEDLVTAGGDGLQTIVNPAEAGDHNERVGFFVGANGADAGYGFSAITGDYVLYRTSTAQIVVP